MSTDILVELLGGSPVGADFTAVDGVHVTALPPFQLPAGRRLHRINRGVGPQLRPGKDAPWMDGAIHWPTLNGLAREIRAVPDQGRVFLIGYSSGAIAALALANVLSSQSPAVKPAYVALLDMPITSDGWSMPEIGWRNRARNRPQLADSAPERTPRAPPRTGALPLCELPAGAADELWNFYQTQGNGWCFTSASSQARNLRFASAIGFQESFGEPSYGHEVHGAVEQGKFQGSCSNRPITVAPRHENDEAFHECLCVEHRADTWVPQVMARLNSP